MATEVVSVKEYRTRGKPTTLLRKVRMDAGLTLDEAADAANISASHLSRMERGDTIPSIIVALNLCSVYNMTAEDLFGDWRDLREE